MSLPQNLQPDPAPVAEESTTTTTTETTTVSTEETVTTPDPAASTDPAPTETPEEIAAEDASDAQLRAWAKDNGIDGVPASGRLSATWRDQITAAMNAAAEAAAAPAEESPAEPEAEPEIVSTDQSSPDSTEEESPAEAEEEVAAERPLTGPGSDQPEFAHGGPDYRSVFQAPDTWMTSQAYTT